MNICFYTDYTISGMTGGIGRVTTILTDYFRKHFDWKVYSIYAFEAKADCKRTENDGSIQLRLHDRLGIRRLSSNYSKAAQFIRKNEIEIIIIQTSMDVVAKLRKELDKQELHQVKIISVLHYTPGTDEFPISTDNLWANLLKGKGSFKIAAKGLIAPVYNYWEHKATINAYRTAYEQGDTVVVLSNSYIESYQEFAGLKTSDKIFAIPNCVPFEYNMTQSELESKQKTALMVGRMVDFPKRVSTILRIWKDIECQPAAKDWNLEIVGDGPDLPTFKNLATNLGLNRCTFTGRQNPIEYYRRASLFFMTSKFEGFPMTLVEAQQMGCVPIAFDSFASLKEVVTDNINGLIVPNNSTQAFIAATLRLMSDSQSLAQLRDAAISNCKEFSQESICNRWKDFLEKL